MVSSPLYFISGSAEKGIYFDINSQIQGAILVSALFQVVIGFSGLMGFVLRFIGPLAIVPTVALIGLSLFGAAANQAAGFWWIAIL